MAATRGCAHDRARLSRLFAAAALGALTLPAAGQIVLYADDSASPGGDGRSWASPYQSVRTAVFEAELGGVSEIRVGGGPQSGFHLVPGVAIRGAYAGFGAADPNVRDLQAYETTIDGRVGYSNPTNGAVLDGFTIRSSFGAAALIGSGSPEVIDCTIVGDEIGMASSSGRPRLTRCHFRQNPEKAFEGVGGAIFIECTFEDGLVSLEFGDYEFVDCRFSNYPARALEAGRDSTVVMRDCTVQACGADRTQRALFFDGDAAEIEGGDFSDNLAGVVEVEGGSLTARGAEFLNNVCEDANGGLGGAAIFAMGSGPIVIEGCLFQRNQTPLDAGGAIVAFAQGAAFTLRDSVFVDNRARSGGAVVMGGGTIERCRFALNQGFLGGGAIDIGLGSPATRLIDCEFEENTGRSGGAVVGLRIVATRCSFVGNVAGEFGGAYYEAAAFGAGVPTVWTDCTFVDNRAARQGGALWLMNDGVWQGCLFTGSRTAEAGGAVYISAGEPRFVGCTFRDSRAHVGGAIATSSYGKLSASRCRFDSNHAFLDGGALHLAGVAAVESSWFHQNTADRSGGALATVLGLGREPRTLHASTLAGNVAEEAGGGVFVGDDVAIEVENTILWGNADFGGMGEPAQVTVGSNAQLTVNYNCVQNWSGNLGGAGNIGDDPRFVDAGTNDYHLAADSPCIDAGDPAYAGRGDERDIDDQRRVWHGRIDMGGDEFGAHAEGDLNCDGVIDAFDIEAFIVALVDPIGYRLAYPDCDPIIADINLDGLVDAFDIGPFIELLIG